MVNQETKKYLPIVLSKDKIKKILGQVNNVRHKLLLALMYAAGLRVSEVCRLKAKDIDFDNNILWVRNSKRGVEFRFNFQKVDLFKLLFRINFSLKID